MITKEEYRKLVEGITKGNPDFPKDLFEVMFEKAWETFNEEQKRNNGNGNTPNH